MNKDSQSKMKKSILLSIPILFIVASPLHFIFDLTGKLVIIGALTPVNESPWEHLKLAFYPILVWWIIYCYRERKAENFSREKWIVSAAAASISAPLTIIMFFYTYKGAFGIELLILDIFSLLLAIAAGQCLGLHIYKYANSKRAVILISLTALIIVAFMFILFTFAPPHIPLFKDGNTGGFGIL